MTPAQRTRLIDIAREIKHVDHWNHPSESYRESWASYTPEDVQATLEALRRVYAKDTTSEALRRVYAKDTTSDFSPIVSTIIGAVDRRCLASVIGLKLNGII